MYMGVLSAFMYVNQLCASCLQTQKESFKSPGTTIIGSGKLFQISGLLEEQPVLLSAAPSFHPT